MTKKERATVELASRANLEAIQGLAARFNILQRRGGGIGQGNAGGIIDELARACEQDLDGVVNALRPIFDNLSKEY